MITPMPGATPLKPGSCTTRLPGITAAIVDEVGGDVAAGHGGFLVIKRPWPSMIRGIWGDPERYVKSYFHQSWVVATWQAMVRNAIKMAASGLWVASTMCSTFRVIA